jgi:predicted GNAT family N-acyltransferase
MLKVIYKKAETLNQIGKAFILRYKVFVLEQGFREDIELDELDNIAIHLIAKNEDETIVGTLRLFASGSAVVLGRMAVEKSYRNKGIGRNLIIQAIAHAKNLGGKYLIAHAQLEALVFYEKTGFQKHGMEFLEEGVPHIEVRMKL